MDMQEAMKVRHAVRAYTDQPVEAEKLEALRQEIARCNAAGGLHIQLVTGEPKAFGGFRGRSFKNVTNYVAMIGPEGADLQERLGYWGEQVVLKATALGLGTCWVAMSFSKGEAESHCALAAGEKLVLAVPVGYAADPGAAHKSKPLEKVCSCPGTMPDWFRRGVEAALLAPTAMNQQKFMFTLNPDGAVVATATGGSLTYGRTDLGIVKCHFELGAGRDSFKWAGA